MMLKLGYVNMILFFVLELIIYNYKRTMLSVSLIYEDMKYSNKVYCFKIIEYDDVELVVMEHNEYINATALCRHYDKEYQEWRRLETTKSLFKSASLIFNVCISLLSIKVNEEHSSHIIGTYIHPILLTSLLTWISPQFLSSINDMLFSNLNASKTWSAFKSSLSGKKDKGMFNKIEKRKQLKLADELKGFIEVKTPIGNIDILTSNEIIEIKDSKNWKHALGQVISYSHYYPHYQKVIYLFGCDEIDDVVLALCKEHDVEVRIC